MACHRVFGGLERSPDGGAHLAQLILGQLDPSTARPQLAS